MTESNTFSDEEIVELVRSHDQELYAVVLERYQQKLFRYAKSLLRDEYRAADVVQEAFIKAFINLHGFNTKMKFSSWIYRIVHNEVMNVLVKQKHELPMLPDVDYESSQDILGDLCREEAQEMVKTCLARMPSLYAEPLFLHFIEEKSYEEISDILRIPIGTVGTRIGRAKLLMRKLCQTIQK